MGFFEYEAEVWNDVDEKMETVHGVTSGKNFTEAMKNIEKYYGKEIDNVLITGLEEHSVYEFETTQSDFCHGMYKLTIEKW